LTQRIRLLWLIDTLRVGGAESLALSYARHYDRSRYELFVCHLHSIEGSTLEDQLREAGAEVVSIGARNLRDWRAFRRLLAFVRDAHIDLIHAHLTYSAIWSAIVSRLTGVPSVASLHVSPQPGRGRALRDRLMRFVLNRWGTTVITVSEALRAEYIAGGGIAAEKIRAVHNGIDGERFARDRATARAVLERDFDIPHDARVAVSVCVLRPRKGIDVLLAAAPEILKRVPGAHFLVSGDGEMRDAWQSLATELGVERAVRWAGYRADVDSFLAGCDLLVHPTLEDAFPTVLLEAMSASLPVVASAVGGVPEIVQPGVTGELVPATDVRRLADAVSRLLGHRGVLGKRGHGSLRVPTRARPRRRGRGRHTDHGA